MKMSASALAGAVLLFGASGPNANETACPAVLKEATRLFLAVAPKMSSPAGHGQLFTREEAGGAWAPAGKRMALTFGRRGLAWAFDHTAFATKGEPVKREGDKRTSAGIFAAGQPFGFGAEKLANYLRLSTGDVCIDDVRSKHYNRVVRQSMMGKGMSHEKMWRIKLYKSGMVVQTPTSRTKRGGSCIFLHVWRAPGKPTIGCVAASWANIRRVQQFFDGEQAAIAFLPKEAAGRFAKCGLPGIG